MPHGPDHDRRSLERLIEERALGVVFQPIIDLHIGAPTGHEALVRPAKEYGFAHAGELFEAAEYHGLLWELEAVCRTCIAEAAQDFPHHELLFMNSTPKVFADPRFATSMVEFAGQLPHLPRSHIVLELTERSETIDTESLGHQFEEMRQLGFLLAIDDVGAGTSGLNRIMRLRPEWLKLDRELISGIDKNAFKTNLLRFFVHFARLSNINLVAEGVEYDGELETVIELGVGHVQGFLLARPGSLTDEINSIWQERIPYLRKRSAERQFIDPRQIHLGDLAKPIPGLAVDVDHATLTRFVGKFEDIPAVGIMSGRRVIGYARMEVLLSHLEDSTEEMPLQELNEPGWILASPDITVPEAIELVSNRPDAHLTAPILVASDDVIGLVDIRTLLKAAASLQNFDTQQTASLTGLPNQLQIDIDFARRIEMVNGASVAFIDIRRLSAYNHAYGFDMGDQMIRCVAGLLMARFHHDQLSMIGHLANDRFVVVSEASDFEDRLAVIAAEFDDCRSRFFSQADIETGDFEVQWPNRTKSRTALTSLRVLLIPEAFKDLRAPSDLQARVEALRTEETTREQLFLGQEGEPLAGEADAMPYRSSA